jgi:hypothetical protein
MMVPDFWSAAVFLMVLAGLSGAAVVGIVWFLVWLL